VHNPAIEAFSRADFLPVDVEKGSKLQAVNTRGLLGCGEAQSMKLSEAILLGSTVARPLAGGLAADPGRQTCAFMMAAAALSKPECLWAEAPQEWPWLSHQLTHVPCGCRAWDRYLPANYMTAIIHIFACHVATKEWTLEQLATWIGSVEPQAEVTLPPAAREAEVFCARDEG
jgi:hypothetical protein